MNDDPFEPVLGRIRARPIRTGTLYRGKVLAAVRLIGHSAGGRGHQTKLSRIGRGSAAAAVLGGVHARRSMRRAVVKTRLARLAGQGIGAAGAHLRYIQRDGAQRDGSPGRLYAADEDEADGKRFIERCAGDRHQFRIIVSAEDGAQYEDLKPLVRRFMQRMELDLATRLEWVAADHVDTGHPHSHIMLRGKDERGDNLVIARDYIAHGMRERVSELVSLDLGPRSALEIGRKLAFEVDAERLTSLDRSLIRLSGEEGSLLPGGRTMAEHAIRLARLRKLESLGLAEPLDGGRWRLQERIEVTLRAMGERGDIIRTMQRALKRARLERPSGDLIAYQPSDGQPLVGRLVDRGLSNELNDHHYLIVDAVDGRTYHVPVGAGSSLESMPIGSILGIGPSRSPQGRPRVDVRSAIPLEALAKYEGATWLDHELSSARPVSLRDAGFGKEVRSALTQRRAWLIGQRLAIGDSGSVELKPGALDQLRQCDLQLAAARIASQSGLSFVEPGSGEPVEGLLRRRVDLGAGRFAMIQNGGEFMLVPWRPMFERHLQRPVAGLVRGDRIDWRMERARGIGR